MLLATCCLLLVVCCLLFVVAVVIKTKTPGSRHSATSTLTSVRMLGDSVDTLGLVDSHWDTNQNGVRH